MKQNNNKTFIIAEAGVNHDGSLQKALKLINVAAAMRQKQNIKNINH